MYAWHLKKVQIKHMPILYSAFLIIVFVLWNYLIQLTATFSSAALYQLPLLYTCNVFVAHRNSIQPIGCVLYMGNLCVPGCKMSCFPYLFSYHSSYSSCFVWVNKPNPHPHSVSILIFPFFIICVALE